MADGVPPPSSNENYTENLSLDSTQDAQELTASLESGCTSSLSTNQSFPTKKIAQSEFYHSPDSDFDLSGVVIPTCIQLPSPPNSPNFEESTTSPHATPDAKIKKLEKMRRMKRLAIEEFVETEQTYVMQLEQLHNHFKPVLKQRLTEEDYQSLFPSILKVISTLNRNFLNTLLSEEDDFSAIIVDFCPYFKMYVEYASIHPSITVTLTRLNDESWFQALCQEVEKKHSLTNSLESLLVTPIQRPTRYQLLIKSIIKNSLDTDYDYENLQTSLKHLLEVNKKINVGIADNERRLQVKKVSDYFGIPLAKPSRRFLKQGQLTRVGKASRKKYMFFLFNDLLLYGSGNHLRGKIRIDSTFSARDRTDPNYANCFEICSSKESFIVYTETPLDKEQWIYAIKQAVIDMLKQGVTKRQSGVIHSLRPAPVYEKRNNVRKCRICESAFSISLWRYNCQICGKVACANCLQQKMKNNKGKSVSACKNCFNNQRSNFSLDRLQRSQNVVIKLPPGAKLESMKQTILLEERVFKKATKPATKISDVVKKACGFIPSDHSPEDYVLCIDEWKQYLTPDKLFKDYFVFHQLSSLSLELSMRRRDSVGDTYKESPNFEVQPSYIKHFDTISNIDFMSEEEDSANAPTSPDSSENYPKQIELVGHEGEDIEFLDPKCQGIYSWRGAMYSRPLYELATKEVSFTVYYSRPTECWVLCDKDKMNRETIAVCRDPDADHPVACTKEWQITFNKESMPSAMRFESSLALTMNSL